MSARVILKHGADEHVVDVLDDGHVQVAGERLEVCAGGSGEVRVGTGPGTVAWAIADGDTRWVYHDGCVYVFEIERRAARRTRRHHGSLAAPMPATVRQINVASGTTVKRGDVLILLEAMKMELPVRAASDGVVTSVNCREGELVPAGVTLLEIDEA